MNKAPEFSASLKKKFVRLLKEAKTKLWDGVGDFGSKTSYICFAIPYKDGKNALRGEIMRRLGTSSTVECWLQFNAKVPRRQLSRKRVQAHRLAWINLLIEEFSQ